MSERQRQEVIDLSEQGLEKLGAVFATSLHWVLEEKAENRRIPDRPFVPSSPAQR